MMISKSSTPSSVIRTPSGSPAEDMLKSKTPISTPFKNTPTKSTQPSVNAFRIAINDITPAVNWIDMEVRGKVVEMSGAGKSHG